MAKGASKRVKGKVKSAVSKGYRFAKGNVKKYGRKAIHAAKKHGVKYAKKYGKKVAAGAWKYGKKAVSKLCGKGKQAQCIKVAQEAFAKGGGS